MRTLALMVAAFCLALLAPSSATAAVVSSDAFALDATEYSIHAEGLIHPQAVYSAGKTYVAYLGPGLAPCVTAFDHNAGRWTPIYRAGAGMPGNDLHGVPAMLVDAAGYVHVFWAGHHSVLMHARSKNPHDISSWTQMADMAPSATYPQALLFSDGSIEVYYRGDGYDWSYRRSVNGGATWSTAARVLNETGGQGMYANFTRNSADEVLCGYTAVDWPQYFTGLSWARHNVYFMRRDAGKTWRNAAGLALAIPIAKAASDTNTRIYSSGTANANEVVVKTAPGGDACVQFLTGSGASYSLRFMRLRGGVWETSEVGRTDHFFDGATFALDSSETVRAYSTEGGTLAVGRERDYLDEGGQIVERVSADGGATWSSPTTISPPVPGAIFNDPITVQDATPTARVVFQEWTYGSPIFALRAYAAGDGGLLGRSFAPGTKRIAGSDRFDVAVRTSREAFPSGSRGAVVVNAFAFADAAVSAPLAYAIDGPVLPTPAAVLSAKTAAELKRLKPATVVVVGGSGSVSERVVRSIRAALPSAKVTRIGGADRYVVAAAVSSRVVATRRVKPGAVFVVRGSAFFDAMSVSPWAAFTGRPILLAEKNWMPPSTAAALRALAATRTIVVGDEGAIGPRIFARLAGPVRIFGSNRYTTSARVARASLVDGMLPLRTVVVGGRDFADPLAASVLAARLRAPMLLTQPTALGAPARSLLASAAGSCVCGYVVGGTASVSDAVRLDAGHLIGVP